MGFNDVKTLLKNCKHVTWELKKITDPKIMSNELCTFLGLPNGSKLSHVQACNEIREYVKSKGLTNQENKKLWIPDDKLKGLFDLKEQDEIGHFSIMRHLKPHLTCISFFDCN